jgi:hypothetical protein
VVNCAYGSAPHRSVTFVMLQLVVKVELIFSLFNDGVSNSYVSVMCGIYVGTVEVRHIFTVSIIVRHTEHMVGVHREELLVVQLIKIFPRFYVTGILITPLDINLSLVNPVHILTFRSFKTRLAEPSGPGLGHKSGPVTYLQVFRLIILCTSPAGQKINCFCRTLSISSYHHHWAQL